MHKEKCWTLQEAMLLYMYLQFVLRLVPKEVMNFWKLTAISFGYFLFLIPFSFPKGLLSCFLVSAFIPRSHSFKISVLSNSTDAIIWLNVVICY